MNVGSVIGHYHILKSLGGGGMGAVYVANDTRLNRKVALKTLPARMANDPEWIRRFEREAQAVGALNHPNIIHVHDFGEEDGTYYFSMEYVSGESIQAVLAREGKIPWVQALDIIIQVA